MLQRIVLSLFLTLLAIYAIALLIDEELNITTQREFLTKASNIYPKIANLDEWSKWNQFTKSTDVTKTTNASGDVIVIKGRDKRNNTITIKRSVATPNSAIKVDYNYTIDGLEVITLTSFTLQQTGNPANPSTVVSWTYTGDYTNLIGAFKVKRILLLFSKWMIKREMDSSLEKLASLK